MEAEDSEAWMIRLLQMVLRGLLTVDQIRVEYVELVALRLNHLKNGSAFKGPG